jgi:hypothetical protein
MSRLERDDIKEDGEIYKDERLHDSTSSQYFSGDQINMKMLSRRKFYYGPYRFGGEA